LQQRLGARREPGEIAGQLPLQADIGERAGNGLRHAGPAGRHLRADPAREAAIDPHHRAQSRALVQSGPQRGMVGVDHRISIQPINSAAGV
jgi:hypothetical protein